LAHDDLVDFTGVYPGPRDGLVDDQLGEILRLDILEPAAQPTYCRSHGADNDNFFHETFS
jgi:hypothetical protein